MPSHAMSIDNLCNDYAQEDYSRHPNWATPEDWDAHQETIRRLYLDEKRPLKDVVVIMETEYGFRATAKMYKTRLAKWKMLKNRPRGTGH
ncbi:Clr5 domain-containing protein [Xylaria sp. CBS 124048]|nr:Clr5 domain-containing protein [Xylaria sp. CBS 124048]